MSNKYKFEITGQQEDQKVQWSLTSRLGCVWKGTFDVVGVTKNGDVHVNVHVDTPRNTPIPYRGQTLLQERLMRFVVRSVKHMLKYPFPVE